MDQKDVGITAEEMIMYLKRFPKDKRVAIVTIDCTKQKKVCFDDKEVIFISDSDQPAIIININTDKTVDITQEHKEAFAGRHNPAKDVHSPKLPTKKGWG